ncbi:hypothetical protein PCH_Pc13g01200 [Penicillium rubens Wisconsin 54-1255]|uniref:Uncharacterized protein n=1 Tax=Penicillium rubens (strain ATCC 28089 / DSM 1075 / NRRL 1951 / Wisconsin 54-1255) TaxID=500485 RepID=B6H190_PENRW|nr:hypothetical protein PCH_Pc13g00520 [Penicillium rubens Wisconsin 54-1255]CAP91189.1 hypothetical protein PCH_Pc13g01200 [Penicillium rubens Wisconsin 54-1255]
MPSRRTTSEAPADAGHGSSESDAAPKRTRRPPSTGHGGPPSGTQGASLHTPLRLEADKTQATAKIRQLSDTNDQNLARIQTLEFQISSLKQQQLDAVQVGNTASDNLLPILLEVSGNFQYAQSQLEKKIEAEKTAEKNKLTFAGFPASDVLQPSWPVYNGQMGSLGTNSLQSYSLPLTNQQAPTQANHQPLPTASQYIPQF